MVDRLEALVAFAKKNYLVLILGILVVYVYLRYFLSVNPKLELLQTTVDKLDIQHLFEKSPIIITDRLVSPMPLLDSLFRYLYVRKSSWLIRNPMFNPYTQSKHRYVVVYATKETAIQLIHPNEYNMGKPRNVVTIPLREKQLIIVPMYWWYSIRGNAFLIELDSIFSLVYRSLHL